MEISVVIPCYNEQEVLNLYYDEMKKVMNLMKNVSFEFIFVDDGSSDNTLNILKELHKNDCRCKYISFSRNYGKEAAMYAGFKHSKGNYTAVMDADLQDPPTLIPEMYKILKNEDYDCVATRRSTRTGENKIRSFLSKEFYKVINKLSKTEIVDGARDFRLMNRKMLDAVLEISEYNRFSKGIFSWVGFKTKWLQYDNIERAAGKTKWSLKKLAIYSIDGITGFSVAPLSIASIAGVLFCGISFFLVILIILRTLIWGDPVSGWPSLACIMFFIGGIQLFCIGIVGQYLAKTYLEVKHRPIYIERESSDEDDMVNSRCKYSFKPKVLRRR